MTPGIRVHPDLEALGSEAARAIVERIAARVAEAGSFALALAGGSTPRALYECLATRHRAEVPWDAVHVYWGDERYVPPEDPASNYRMAREALLDRVTVPAENIHPMPTESPEPDTSAVVYESMLRERFGPDGPRFDLALLGIGAEGHTASLFPGSPALTETRRWVVPAKALAEPVQRLTLTLPALNRAREVFFLVVGEAKAPAVARALEETTSHTDCPAAGVRPTAGTTTWWLDASAAALLRLPPGSD